jgi:L-ascorbate metabolism protein UlaG (beta-lactamase superfamily)
MKITKYIHSCILIEKDGTSVLVDPGSYTLEEDALPVEDLESLDVVLITHEHEDHMSIPLLKRIMGHFPKVKIVTSGTVADLLAKEGIPATIQKPEFIETQESLHERVLALAPHNTLFHVFNEVTHPGDSLQFTESKEILALPIQAPWGSMVAALEKAVSLNPKPKLVIPIHDWHWREEARHRAYETAANYLREHGIREFRGLEPGESIDIIHSDNHNI